jgi:hypothetical protein
MFTSTEEEGKVADSRRLPDSIDAWMRLSEEEWIPTWEILRPFFLDAGYDLYHKFDGLSTVRPLDSSLFNQ